MPNSKHALLLKISRQAHVHLLTSFLGSVFDLSICLCSKLNLQIHQRHGARGTILWYITLAMVAAGFVQFFMFISKAMFPPKND